MTIFISLIVLALFAFAFHVLANVNSAMKHTHEDEPHLYIGAVQEHEMFNQNNL